MPESPTERTAVEPPEATLNYFESFGLSDTGQIRAHNEDSFLCLAQHGIFCVADGMGGMRDGALASQTTVNCIAQAFKALYTETEAPGFKQRRDTLVAALEEANRRMQLPPGSGTDRRRSGSTVVALLLDTGNPATATAIHAGDSRLYRLRNGRLNQLTTDHSAAAFLKEFSDHEQDSLLASELKSVVTRGIGLGKKLNQEEKRIDIRKDDVLMLCSDGLSNMLNADRIRDVLTQCTDTGGVSTEQTSRMLIDAANEAGGHDNVTAIVVHITGDLPDAETATTAFSSETDELTETTATSGQEPHSPWDKYHQLFSNPTPGTRTILLAGGIGLVMLIALGIILLNRPPTSEGTPPPPIVKENPRPLVVQKHFDPEQRLRLLDELETEFNATLISGQWNIIQAKIDTAFQDGTLLPSDRSHLLMQRSAQWYALWRDATGNVQALIQALGETVDEQNANLSKIGSQPGLATLVTDWPTHPDAAAAVFCAEVHRIRQEVIRRIIDARDETISALQTRIDAMNHSEFPGKQDGLQDAEKKRTALGGDVADLLPILNEPGLGPRQTAIPWNRLIPAFQAVQNAALPEAPPHPPEPAQKPPILPTPLATTDVNPGERVE